MPEVAVLLSLRNFAESPGTLRFWETVTTLGDSGLVWIAIALFLTFSKYTRAAGCAVATALFCGFLICNAFLKPLVDRLRPCEILPDNLLFPCPMDPSFPSGHTTASFAAALALAAFYPRTGAATLILAVLIAYSRMFLFVHWPSDVFAGVLIGVVSAILAVRWIKPLFPMPGLTLSARMLIG